MRTDYPISFYALHWDSIVLDDRIALIASRTDRDVFLLADHIADLDAMSVDDLIQHWVASSYLSLVRADALYWEIYPDKERIMFLSTRTDQQLLLLARYLAHLASQSIDVLINAWVSAGYLSIARAGAILALGDEI